jgi:hypothetical protein
MFKKVFAFLVLIVLLGTSFGAAVAKNDKDKTGDSDIPEADGVYDVAGHPELKVRVFVHKAKPGPVPAPQLQCGLADLDSNSTVASAGWKLPSTFIYNLNPNNVPALVGSANWPTIAENSFDAWENALIFATSTAGVNVSRGSDTAVFRKGLDGKNIVAWGSISGSALGVTYIWYNPATMQVRELDTILNQKFGWAWSGGSSTCAYTNSYDAQNILTHEIGHWFGLNDHYTAEYANNTMY